MVFAAFIGGKFMLFWFCSVRMQG